LTLEYDPAQPLYLFYLQIGRPDLALEELEEMDQMTELTIEIFLKNMIRLIEQTSDEYSIELAKRDGILHQIVNSLEHIKARELRMKNPIYRSLLEIGIVTIDALVDLAKDYRLLYPEETGWDYVSALIRLYNLARIENSTIAHAVQEQTHKKIADILERDDFSIPEEDIFTWLKKELRPQANGTLAAA